MDDLNARHFELPAMCVPMIASYVTDASRFFTDGKDYMAFRTLDESIRAVESLLKYDDTRTMMAEQGYKTVVEGKNSYEDRVETVLKDQGFI
jgi:spore maturation protein CgeB